MKALDFSKDFSWERKSPLSTNKRNKIGILRLFDIFSKMWKMGERWRAKKIEESTEPWPTFTSTSTWKRGEIKSFHQYWVFLPIK